MLTIGIVATLNQFDYIKTCIESCLKSDLAEKNLLRIILVDNASQPNVQKLLLAYATTYKSTVSLISNDTNVGYAKACNQIINECHTDFLVLIHADTVIPYCFPGILFSQLEALPANVAFISPATSYANEQAVCLSSIRSHFERIKPNNKGFYTQKALLNTLTTLYSGSLNKFALFNFTTHKDTPLLPLRESCSFCIAGKLSTFQSLKGFDERFTIRGFEDKELFLRIKRLGLDWKFCPQLFIHHHGNLFTDGAGFHFSLVMRSQEDIFNQIKQESLQTFSTEEASKKLSNDVRCTTNVKGSVLRNFIPLLDSSQIIHVVNFSDFPETSRLYKAQRLLVDSIHQSALGYNIKKVGCVRQDLEIDGFELVTLPRDALSSFPDAKDYPYLKDMLDIGCRHAKDNDWIVFCNTDCVLSPDFYKNLLGCGQAKFVQYTRLDVYNNPTTLDQVFTYPNRPYNIGIDGFAIRKSLYLQVKDKLPDFVIGQPHWDSFYSAFFRTSNLLSQNYIDLYHVNHPVAWSDAGASPITEHQRLLLENSGVTRLENNLFADILPEHKDTAAVLYFCNPTKLQLETFQTLVETQTFSGDYIIVELFREQETKALLNVPNSRYIGIRISELHEGIDNRFESYNYVLANSKTLLDSQYEYFIFIDTLSYSLQSNWLAKLRLELVQNKNIVFGFSKIIDANNKQYLNYVHACKNWIKEQPHTIGKVFGFPRGGFENFRFNTQNIVDCGDDIFVTQVVGNVEDFTHIHTNKYLNEKVQKVETTYDVLDMEIWTNETIDNVTKNQKTSTLAIIPRIQESITQDSYGLTRWVTRSYLDRFKSISNISNLDELANHFDNLTDNKQRELAVIIPTYGRGRIHLIKTVIERLLQQDLRAQIIVIELLFDDQPSDLSHPLITHVVLRGDDKHKDLCQKEALLNLGVKAIEPQIKYLFFVDNDVYSLDRKWLQRVKEKLVENPNNIVQGFTRVIDSLDPNYQFFSLIYARQNNLTTAKCNPGICWGITVDLFKTIKGFNPFFLEYSGDSGFVVEVLNTDRMTYDGYLIEYQCFSTILRKGVPKGKATYIDVTLIHLNHGFFKDRSYNVRKYIIDSWTKALPTLIGLDSEGLIYWKDCECIERKSLQAIPPNDDHTMVDKFFEQNNYKIRAGRNAQQHKAHPIASEGVSTNKPKSLPPKYLIPELGLNFSYYDSPCWSENVKGAQGNSPPLDKQEKAIVLEPLINECKFSIPITCGYTIVNIPFVSEKNLVLEISGEGRISLQFQLDQLFSGKLAMNIEKRSLIRIPLREFVTKDFDFSKVQTLVMNCEKCKKLLIHKITIE